MDRKICRLSLLTLWGTMEWIFLSGLILAVMLVKHNPELWIVGLGSVLAFVFLFVVGIAWWRGLLGRYIRVSWQSGFWTIKKAQVLLGLCLVVALISGVLALAIAITYLVQLPDNTLKMGIIGLLMICWGVAVILVVGLWQLRRVGQ